MWCLAMLTHVYHIRKLDPVYATLHRVAVYWTLLTVNPLEKLSKKNRQDQVTESVGLYSRHNWTLLTRLWLIHWTPLTQQIIYI